MKKILLTGIPLLIIIVSFFYLSTNVTGQLPNTTLQNYNLNSDKEPLKIADMEELFERISDNGVGFCIELEDVKIKGETVSVVLVNENYLNVMNICKEEISTGNVAIISNKLALKLFFNTKAENKELMLNGKNYKTTAVYNESSGIINDISKDGKERIYIPYTCVKNCRNLYVDSIAYSNDSSSAPLIEQMDLSQYHSVDFSEKSKVIHTFEHLMYLIMYIGIFLISLKLWRLLCKKYFNEIKDHLKESYFLKSIHLIPGKYILLIIIGIGIPLILLNIFVFSDFSIYIVSKYIPNDNIFDVSYYINSIIENSNLLNSIALTGNNYLSVLYSKTFDILISIFILFVISHFIIIYRILNKLKTI